MLTNQQLEKLSDLFLDIAKGLFLAGFAIPIFTKVEFAFFLKTFTMGVVFAYFSLKLLVVKER